MYLASEENRIMTVLPYLSLSLSLHVCVCVSLVERETVRLSMVTIQKILRSEIMFGKR